MFDIVIVGTGPAGVSAAYPLAEAGFRILLIDADDGVPAAAPVPVGSYFDLRRRDASMNRWLSVPAAFLDDAARTSSPKLRSATQASFFKDFLGENKIASDSVSLVGSLSSGGLSNAWGCGVAAFDADDLESFPIRADELAPSMRVVAKRTGLSGRRSDQLERYFGIDEWCAPAFRFDRAVERLVRKHEARAELDGSVRFGAARNAVLARDTEMRNGCDTSGLCMWGCARGALYSSRFDIARLRHFPNVTHQSGVVVERMESRGSAWAVIGRQRSSSSSVAFSGRRIIMAAGTIATTAIVARSLELDRPIRLLSTPSAAFLLWQPSLVGSLPHPSTGFAQASIVATGGGFGVAHGNLFSTVNLPASEFLPHMPLSRPAAISLWKALHPSFVVGNTFIGGAYSDLSLTLRQDGTLAATGGFSPDCSAAFSALQRKLTVFFRNLGAVLVPGSFTRGSPGSDIHYAGTLPMRVRPVQGECAPNGEIAGLPGVHVADAANFSSLPAKPHTLTMMANADRIARSMLRNTP